jgi:hypothetical protein
MSRETGYKELVYVITDAEKFHDLSSTNWRPRKAEGVIHQSHSKMHLNPKS